MKIDISSKFNMLVLDRMLGVVFGEIQYRRRVAVGPAKTKLYIHSNDNDRHHLPHVHIKHPKGEFVVNIVDCTLIKGEIKGNSRKHILKFIESKQAEFIKIWNELNPKKPIK